MFVKTSLYGVIYTKMNIRRYKNGKYFRSKSSKKYYKIKTGLLQKTQYVKAVDDVSFSIKKGQTFGLVGESGCGKSTLGKVIIRLEDATSGSIIVNGEDITRLQGKKLRKSRQQYQMIFQDPYASLNPMQMVGDIISEPILNYKKLPKEEIKKKFYIY